MPPAWIDLDGTANTRDVGGLPTTDGRRTVHGRLLRSDDLQDLTPQDVRRLRDDLGVRTVVDLRAEIELEARGGGPLTREPGIAVANLSLFPVATGPVRVGAAAANPSAANPSAANPSAANPSAELSEQARRRAGGRSGTGTGFVSTYLGFLADRPDSVLAALRLIAHGGGATLVHCTAGKDRTGVVVALALAAVGVERAAVVADFAASADHYEAVLRRLAPATRDDDLVRVAALRHIPRAVTMERFLDAVDRELGGPASWLVEQGWTTADQASLRRTLLEP